jgi:hypothetical protein
MIKTWPSNLIPSRFSAQLEVAQIANTSGFGGSTQVLDLLNERWKITMTLPGRASKNATLHDEFIQSLRGMVNTTQVYHYGRPLSLGTISGSPTIRTQAAIGAAVLDVQTVANVTLKAGDIIGVSGLWLMVEENCQANLSGVMSVPLVNRVRKVLSAGAAVNYSRPLLEVRKMSVSAVEYLPRQIDEIQLEFVEAI